MKMTILHLIGMIAEIWAVIFLVWGAFNEQKLIAFERRIAKRWRGRKNENHNQAAVD